MYLRSVTDLSARVAARRRQQKILHEAINDWVEQSYGLQDYLGILARYHSVFIPNYKTKAVLARQIVSISAEDLAFTIWSNTFGLTPTPMSFSDDTFVTISHDKVARIKIPWIAKGRKGMFVQHERILPKNSQPEKMRLSRIKTCSGHTLPEYHLDLRRKVLNGNHEVLDISSLFSLLVSQAEKKPDFVYITGSDGRDQKIPTQEVSADLWAKPGAVRPPAHWYYPLYLSWFITGSMVLCETYENPEGGVPEAKKLFESSAGIVASVTGCWPLVVEIPHLSKDMLYCNRHICDHGLVRQWFRHLPQGHDTVTDFRSIAEAVNSHYPPSR